MITELPAQSIYYQIVDAHRPIGAEVKDSSFKSHFYDIAWFRAVEKYENRAHGRHTKSDVIVQKPIQQM